MCWDCPVPKNVQNSKGCGAAHSEVRAARDAFEQLLGKTIAQSIRCPPGISKAKYLLILK